MVHKSQDDDWEHVIKAPPLCTYVYRQHMFKRWALSLQGSQYSLDIFDPVALH